MSSAATDRMVTRRRNGHKVGALQRRVKELREGVCSAGTCEKVRELNTKHQTDFTNMKLRAIDAMDALHAYREDAPHVVAVLDAECSFFTRIWFAVKFVLFGLSRKPTWKEVPQW